MNDVSYLPPLTALAVLVIHDVFQYSETNVTHFLFSVLRIKGLYMSRALLAHPQEALQKRHLVYCVRIMSVDCGAVAEQPRHIQLT
jgi:hypothetical protein